MSFQPRSFGSQNERTKCTNKRPLVSHSQNPVMLLLDCKWGFSDFLKKRESHPITQARSAPNFNRNDLSGSLVEVLIYTCIFRLHISVGFLKSPIPIPRQISPNKDTEGDTSHLRIYILSNDTFCWRYPAFLCSSWRKSMAFWGIVHLYSYLDCNSTLERNRSCN